MLRGDYKLSEIWSWAGWVGYDFIDYKRIARSDDRLTLGSTVNYSLFRNFALTFDYQHVNLDSSVSSNSFDRNVYTFGGTYKF